VQKGLSCKSDDATTPAEPNTPYSARGARPQSRSGQTVSVIVEVTNMPHAYRFEVRLSTRLASTRPNAANNYGCLPSSITSQEYREVEAIAACS
jgi:hypothetical protein